MMMTNVQIGSLVLNAALLVYLAAGLMGVAALRNHRRKDDNRDWDVSIAWNAVLLWIAVWKGSLLLIDPAGVVRQPLSLLFFDGGTAGFWLACAVAVLYSWYRYGKRYGHPAALRLISVIASGWLAVYLLGQLLLAAPYTGFGHWLALAIVVASGTLLQNPRGSADWLMGHPAWSGDKAAAGKLAAQGTGVLLLAVLISYMLYDQTLASNRGGATGNWPIEDGMAVGARAGNMAPAFELASLAGEGLTLDEYRGRTVMVNFWTTWCKVCRTEMPHVEKLYAYYEAAPDEEVAIVTINATSQESSAEQVKRYIEEYGYTFPVALDERGFARELYRITAYPTTFIIDGNGVVRERFLGAISYGDMKRRIERVREIGN